MVQITEKFWFPELGEYQDWLARNKKELSDKGFQVLKVEDHSTYTGGARVLFTIQEGQS